MQTVGSGKQAKVLAITLFLICGTISTFAYKLMGSQQVEEGGHKKMFFHPYMQSFTMFVGQALCLLLYISNLQKNRLPVEPGKTPHTFMIFLVPALSDACSSILQYMGLAFISGSTYMMFKGASLITTALFSKLLFQMQIQRRHLAGCGLALVGITVVGSSGLLDQKQGQESTFQKQLVGYILMIISLVFNGFLYAYEQLLMRKHSINPMQMIGTEGVFGLIFVSLIALSFSLIPCGFPQKNCVFDPNGYSYMERVDVFFKQVFDHWLIAVFVVIGILTLSVYNLNGVRITKLFDALTRSLLNVTKTSVVWIVGIIITVTLGEENSNYKIESLNVLVNVVKAVGFTSIIIGTLIYNQLIFKSVFGDKTEPKINEVSPSQDALKDSLISQDQKAK